MSESFVADCSVGIAWIQPSQATDLTRRLLDDAKQGTAIHVPTLWHIEIANGLLVAVRRKLMSESQRQTGLVLLGQLRLIVDREMDRFAFSTISELAREHSISAYDAVYLELARRKSIPLGTRDEAMKAAAKKTGIRVL